MCPSKVEPDSSLGPLPLERPLPPLRLLPGHLLASLASSQLLLLVELSVDLAVEPWNPEPLYSLAFVFAFALPPYPSLSFSTSTVICVRLCLFLSVYVC